MKTRQSMLLGAFAAALFIGTILFLARSPRPAQSTLNSPEAAPLPVEERSKPLAHSETVAVTSTGPNEAVTPISTVLDLPELAREPVDALCVPRELVLATVNGTEIQLKDLVPLEAQEFEKVMTADEYHSRLNRAIEMELTFEAAAAQDVKLTAGQSKRVDGIAQKHEATFQEYSKQGVTWSSLTAAQLEFAQRLTASLLLQQNLVAREAGVAPSSDSAIQQRYEQVLREMLERLKANSNTSAGGF